MTTVGLAAKVLKVTVLLPSEQLAPLLSKGRSFPWAHKMVKEWSEHRRLRTSQPISQLIMQELSGRDGQGNHQPWVVTTMHTRSNQFMNAVEGYF